MSSQLAPGSDPNSPSLKKKGVDGPAPKAQPEDTTLNEDGMPLNPGDQPVQFIPAGQDPANGDAKVEIGDAGGHPKFVGLGKEELMKFANDPFWVRLRWFLFILFWVIWLAMLVGAVVIILYAPKCSDKLVGPTDGPYLQVQVKDVSSNQKLDGIGAASIKNLKDMGVNTVIISQILETDPGTNDPEQVIDFRAIDTMYGNVDHLKSLIERLHDGAIKVLLQLVPNHSSIKHPWFTNASTVENYYVTKDANENSTWASQVTLDQPGSAWSPIPPNILPNANKSYLHQFDSSTADLNYKNPAVVTEMNKVIEFWNDIGVDGFLLSKVSYLLENVGDKARQGAMMNQANADVVMRMVDAKDWDENKKGNRSAPYALVEVSNLATDKSIAYYSENVAVISTSLANLKGNLTSEQVRKAVEETLTKITKYAVHWKAPSAKSADPNAKSLILLAATLRGQIVLSVEDLALKGQSISRVDQFYKDVLNVTAAFNQSQDGGGSTEYHVPNDQVLILKRSNENDFIVVINVGSASEKVDLSGTKGEAEAVVLAATPNAGLAKGAIVKGSDDSIEIAGNSAVVLQVKKAE